MGDQIKKPNLVYLTQVNVAGVFEDEAADIFPVDEINVSALSLGLSGPRDLWP